MYRCAVLLLTLIAITKIVDSKSKNYENFNIDSVLGNKQRSQQFFDCVVNEPSCTKSDKVLKYDLIEMFSTNCRACTPREKLKIEEVKKRAISDPNIMKLALSANAKLQQQNRGR